MNFREQVRENFKPVMALAMVLVGLGLMMCAIAHQDAQSAPDHVAPYCDEYGALVYERGDSAFWIVRNAPECAKSKTVQVAA